MRATGLLAEAPTPDAAAAAPAAGPRAEVEFGQEDLARIGSALDPNKPPVQNDWSEQMVNTVCDLGRQQGGVTDEQGGRNFELARTVLATDGATGTKDLGAADLAAVLKMSGVDLGKVDPNQLQSAARYVSGATTLEEQQDKLRKTIDNFQVLEKIGLPKLSRQQMVDELWGVAKVPGHALAKLSDADVAKKLQEVLGTVNAGPGKSEIKIGKYNLKLEVGQNGTVEKSSCKKPSFFSKIVKITKIVTPIALTILSFTPLAPFALAAQGAIAMVQAIKAKSLLGIATAAASLAGAGGAIVSKIAGGVGKVAATAAKVAKLANSAGRALQGVSSLKSGNFIGGLASIGSGIASGMSSFAGSAAKGLGKFADNLNKVSTKLSAVGAGVASFEGYKRASQAVSAAKEGLQAAQASGDARAIAAAQKRLSQAESQKRAALIGGAAGAATAASALVGARGMFKGQSKAISPAPTRLESKLRLVSQGLGVAQSVAGKDYTGAAVSALSFGATVNSREKGGKENRLNDAANIAQAGLGYYQAEKGRTAANHTVSDAQSRLDAARKTGNADAVRQAESDLKKAKGAAESALMGGIAAGESLLGTAKDIGERDRLVKQEKAKAEHETTLKSLDEGKKTTDRLSALADDPNATPGMQAAAKEEKARLKATGDKLDKAMFAAKGDPDKIKAAREDYERVQTSVASRAADLTRMAAAGAPGLASMRRPQRIGAAKVTKDVTVWEVSQRTGVPVERILEFNAQSGNRLDPHHLQIGQQILVPLDKEDIQFKPLSAEQVRDLKQKAIAEKKAKESIAVPSARSSDQPAPPPEDLRSKSLHLLANDRAIVADDVKNAEFKLSDPTTWVDTKQEKARALARDAFKQSVDRLESVLNDRTSTDAQIHSAIVDKQTALNLYSSARGAAEKRNEGANYLTPVAEAYKAAVADPFHEQTKKMTDAIDNLPVPELVKTALKTPLEFIDKEVAFDFKGAIQTGQDALHSVTKPVIDAIEKSGAPAPLVAAATLPLHVADGVIDFDAGVGKHGVSIVEGIANMVIHPADTAEGLAHLGVRAMETSPQGRAALFVKDLATGRFKTEDEALKAMQDSVDPILMAKAGYELSRDVAKGVLAESIKLIKEGKYEEAAGSVFGQIAEVFVGVGAAKLGAAAEVAETTSRVGRAERVLDATVQSTRTVEGVEEVARTGQAADVTRGLDQAAAASQALKPGGAVVDVQRTAQAAEEASAPVRGTSSVGSTGTIQPKTTGTPEVSFLFDESGLTVRAEGQITGPHRGRGKGYRPEPAGGREPGDHRGHLIPEGGVEDPRLVNVKPNIISEAPRSNLGAKKIFDNLVSRIAAENPNSVIKVIAEPLRRPGQRRPFAVTYWIEKDGVRIHGQSILNKK